MTDSIGGIPSVELRTRGRWRRRLWWWMGGQLFATTRGLALWRKYAAPVEAPLMKATNGRIRLSKGVPTLVLTSVGSRSNKRRDVPLAYFTDRGDVILIASNYGGPNHPAWYHNLRANPQCELHIGRRGGPFVAREVTVAGDRDRLYELAVDRLAHVFALHERRVGAARVIPVLRLTPAGE